MSLTFDDIKAAAARIAPFVPPTQMRHSRKLSALTGAEVWVKQENEQFTGSFKDRGACNKLEVMNAADRARGVITASAGNHAQALACQAQRRGVKALIVMPEATPTVKVEQTRGFGAEIVLTGETLDDSAIRAHEIEAERGMIFVSAFDDYDIMAGQGTAGLEMMTQAPDLDDLIVPIGGGGLISGVATAAKAIKPGVRVFGVEAEMYPSFLARMKGEKPVIGRQTLADGIAVKQAGERTFATAGPLIEEIMLVAEDSL
ncbi:MAG: pyridoxal-phosphate dependent enzyme, partial [Caulobacteraceae bacterium]